MTKKELMVGSMHNGQLIKARLDDISEYPATNYSRARTNYFCTNLNTGRTLRLRSMVKFVKLDPKEPA
jgi:hypothetical protein